MNRELILVANATHARLFTRDTVHDPLIPLATIEDTEGRNKVSELSDDRAGHSSHDRRPGGVDFAPRMDPKRKRHLRFAHELSLQIDDALQQGCRHVTIFSSCPFLGELKGALSPAAQKALRAAMDADLTPLALTELEERIAEQMRQPQP
jgi:hypothetical protein